MMWNRRDAHPMNTKDPRRTAKKQWRAAQREANRSLLPQPPETLGLLFDFLSDSLALEGCDHTLKHTRAWTLQSGVDESSLLAWLEDNGGFCDCEALANSREAWVDAMKAD